eukprot:jgi/Chlat1/8231/Chrsp77S07679
MPPDISGTVIVQGVGNEVLAAGAIAALSIPALAALAWQQWGPGVRCPSAVCKLLDACRGAFGCVGGMLRRALPFRSSDPTRGPNNHSLCEEEALLTEEAVPHEGCCSVCHEEHFTRPARTDCGHWFCAACVLRVWQFHGRASMQPAPCPICRSPIKRLTLTRTTSHEGAESEETRAIRTYNAVFGSAPIPMRWRHAPLLAWRAFGALMNPQSCVTLLRSARALFYITAVVIYLLSPFDLVPEGVLGMLGWLDDLVLVGFVLCYARAIMRLATDRN